MVYFGFEADDWSFEREVIKLELKDEDSSLER